MVLVQGGARDTHFSPLLVQTLWLRWLHMTRVTATMSPPDLSACNSEAKKMERRPW